jgi:hypothetical protein
MAKVIPINPDRAQAMRWLLSRLDWEQRLNVLRDPSPVEPARTEAPVAA